MSKTNGSSNLGTTQTHRAGRVPLSEKIFFGMGDFFGGGGGTLISIVYFKYLTDVLLVPAGVAGTVVLISKVWDAVNDPLMGRITDNTHSKFGRRRPFLFAGGILILLAMALLFLPIADAPVVLKSAVVLLSYLFYNTVSTIIAVPYSSFSSEISNDYNERNAVNSIRLAISQVASLICAVVPLQVRDALIPRFGVQYGYLGMALVFGAVFAVCLLATAIFSKERITAAESDEKSAYSLRSFAEPLRVHNFRLLILQYLFTFVAMEVVLNLFQYFMEYVAHYKDVDLVIGTLILAQIPIIPLVYRLTKRLPKPKIFMIFAPFWVVGAIAMACYQPNWPVAFIFMFASITGVGLCGCTMVPWLIFPDATDVGELAFGQRNAGQFSGIMTFFRTLSAAIAVALIGWVLQWTGYSPALGVDGQSASAILGIRLILGVSAVLFLGAALLFARQNKLTQAKSLLIEQALNCQREGKALPPELAAQIAPLKRELIGEWATGGKKA